MDKQKVMNMFVSKLEDKILIMKAAAADAHASATNEESKAENKYDTRGLEASYLAGAQAQRSAEMERDLHLLKSIELRASIKVEYNALFIVDEEDSSDKKTFFFLPTLGGESIELEGTVITVLTPSSPMGALLQGQSEEGVVEFKRKGTSKEIEVLKIY